MSVLYDKSLDQIAPHSWKMSLGLAMLPSCYSKSNLWHYTMDLLVFILLNILTRNNLDAEVSLMANSLAIMLISSGGAEQVGTFFWRNR